MSPGVTQAPRTPERYRTCPPDSIRSCVFGLATSQESRRSFRSMPVASRRIGLHAGSCTCVAVSGHLCFRMSSVDFHPINYIHRASDLTRAHSPYTSADASRQVARTIAAAFRGAGSEARKHATANYTLSEQRGCRQAAGASIQILSQTRLSSSTHGDIIILAMDEMAHGDTHATCIRRSALILLAALGLDA